ncbi:MAG: penicillin-binding protein 1C, partial [Bacteroidetes bacterium]|nr:penicillin-binding protein 1C [Bacteroidota bacterium]
AWLVTDILSGHDRPDLPAELRATSRLPRFAWKTGTSYGKRDAWAIGWNQRYTIGVWMGNFSGQGAPRLSGTEMAVPLLIDLFDAIDSRQAPVGRPAEIGRREVCVSSGLLPSDRCTQFMQDYYIEGRSGNQRCDLQRAYQLSADLAMHYCMDCVPDSGAVEKWYPVYDAELSVWFEMQHVAIEKPPPHNPDCTMRRSGRGPGIISPSADYTYYLERDADQQIMLHAASPAGVKRQHWYVDGELHATVRNGEKTFFTPAAKLHRIICMDDAGRSSSSTIRIQYY